MVFSSVSFLFAFLPVVLTGYYLLPRRLKNVFLLLVSFLFYFSSEVWLTWIMLVSIFVDYGCALLITRTRLSKHGKRTAVQRGALYVSLTTVLRTLCIWIIPGKGAIRRRLSRAGNRTFWCLPCRKLWFWTICAGG
jgi:D-alanyl-lipoteichoic acid acyltransferase DltB (MBOAT superfamily)